MIEWPHWLYSLLFSSSGITWDSDSSKGHSWFRTYGQIMHFSPIDSSFTYWRLYIKLGAHHWYPSVCVAGYQPNAGMALFIWHRKIFDCRAFAQMRLAKREGWKDFIPRGE